MGPRPTAFGHGGYSGSRGYADPEYDLAGGLTKNRLVVEAPGLDASWPILHAIRSALGIPDQHSG